VENHQQKFESCKLPTARLLPHSRQTWHPSAYTLRHIYVLLYLVLILLFFQGLSITLRTIRFKVQRFYTVLTLRLCDVYGSQNQQLLFSCKTLTERYCITEVGSVYCAVRTESLHETDHLSVSPLKGWFYEEKTGKLPTR
jgi:hypothetical protein